VGAFTLTLIIPLYQWFYYHRLWEPLPDNTAVWFCSVLLYDFLYYWFHRLSHSLRILWNVHSVHHQAKRLVPSLGLRSSAFDFSVYWMLLAPLLWLGFSSEALVFTLAVHGGYQLFIHNDTGFRGGILGGFLNMPSHHKVHHAIDSEYLDKNFGSILIVWDRLFGTYIDGASERIKNNPPKIGVLGAYSIVNPLMSNFLPWIESIKPMTNDKAKTRNIEFIVISIASIIGLINILIGNEIGTFISIGVIILFFIAAVLPKLLEKRS
tara:strand:+ start:452 stop:1249 length:798 start_codon:yes stop_codon:yes gene_type:complete